MSFCPELTLKIDVNSSCINHFFIEKNTFTDGIHFSEWRMHFFYSALLCIVVHPKCFTIMWGVSPQPPAVCSITDATAATGQRRQCTLHTPATGGEEREIESIKWMRIIRRPYLTRDSGGNFGQDTGVTPLLFTRSAMGFFMSTESQDLSLTSHPKDGTFYIIL